LAGFQGSLRESFFKGKIKNSTKSKTPFKEEFPERFKETVFGDQQSSFPNIPLKLSKLKSLTKKKLTKSQNSKNAKLTNRT
jgi:hypothetical protein